MRFESRFKNVKTPDTYFYLMAVETGCRISLASDYMRAYYGNNSRHFLENAGTSGVMMGRHDPDGYRNGILTRCFPWLKGAVLAENLGTELER